jgi:hypothetical protein
MTALATLLASFVFSPNFPPNMPSCHHDVAPYSSGSGSYQVRVAAQSDTVLMKYRGQLYQSAAIKLLSSNSGDNLA